MEHDPFLRGFLRIIGQRRPSEIARWLGMSRSSWHQILSGKRLLPEHHAAWILHRWPELDSLYAQSIRERYPERANGYYPPRATDEEGAA